MKMKEVLQQTGLTDRAVRLYIDSGLVSPDIEENYSGRKNIEFSENDIDRLKNIALLRKIGFSIPDIKQIASGGENTKPIIEAFIQQKQESIENDTLVLEKLKSISLDTQITMDSLCLQLSSAAENKQVPQEDLQLSKDEKRRREDYIAIAVIGIIAPVLVMAFIVFLRIWGHDNMVFGVEDVKFYLITFRNWFVIVALSLIMLFINKPKFVSEKKGKVRKHLSRLLFLVNTVICVFALSSSLVVLIFSISVTEYTTDPNDYLEQSNQYIYSDEILKVFPKEIPDSQVMYDGLFKDKYKPSTVYYYHHVQSLDDVWDVFAQWQLPRKEFYEEVDLKRSNASEIVQKGDWTMCYFIGNAKEEKEESYYDILAFAYKEDTLTVRYMCSGNIGYYENSPYYLTLDW